MSEDEGAKGALRTMALRTLASVTFRTLNALADDVRLKVPLKSLAFLYMDVLNRGGVEDEPPCCAGCCGPCGAMIQAFDAGILEEILRAAPTVEGHDWWVDGKVDPAYVAEHWVREDEICAHDETEATAAEVRAMMEDAESVWVIDEDERARLE